MASANAKKKCRQYSQEYLKFGFITSFSNETMPMCLLCQKVLKEKIRNQPNLKSFFKAPALVRRLLYQLLKNAKTVQRRIDEMASDVEKTLVLELQHCKFSIQLDESAFGCSNILMAYVRYYSQSLKCIVDEFLFANYLKGATDGAPAMVGCYRGFATLLKETVPDVRAVHCVLHRHHLVAKNLSGELHAALKTLCEELKKCKNHCSMWQVQSLLLCNDV
ncbi:SCAN domain-containing protein [Trichinella spiralis]|uniref:SCAN domain-containing protein n=1 Tax=Trichinella spiralis TaxID=6334 RepID=A0ABR3KD41_TRISP